MYETKINTMSEDNITYSFKYYQMEIIASSDKKLFKEAMIELRDLLSKSIEKIECNERENNNGI